MNESTDLRAEDNRLNTLVRLFQRESKAVTISAVSLIVAILALLQSAMAWNDAKTARIQAEMQQKVIDKYQRKVEIYEVRYANLLAYMRANGIELEEE